MSFGRNTAFLRTATLARRDVLFGLAALTALAPLGVRMAAAQEAPVVIPPPDRDL